MRKLILPAIVAIGLGAAAPAMAYDTGDQVSMQAALDVATDIGVMTISHTEFAGDEWQIQGRDMRGEYMEVDVEAATGRILTVDH